MGPSSQAVRVLLDNGTRLLIATTFDGDWDIYIDDFVAVGVLDASDLFLIHCEGYPDEGWRASLTVEQAKEFLTANQVTAEDFWLDYPGVTAKEIKNALALQQAFQQVLDTPRRRRGSAEPGPQAAAGSGGRLTPSPSFGWGEPTRLASPVPPGVRGLLCEREPQPMSDRVPD